MRLLERIATWFDDWKLPGRSGIDSDGTDINPATGLPTLYVPSWPEISRVIEDCR